MTLTALFSTLAARQFDSLPKTARIAIANALSRYRAGHGAKNTAILRRFARGLVRANKLKGSVK